MGLIGPGHGDFARQGQGATCAAKVRYMPEERFQQWWCTEGVLASVAGPALTVTGMVKPACKAWATATCLQAGSTKSRSGQSRVH